MNKSANKSCHYCTALFATVTDRKLSLQGLVICCKWGVLGMLVIWDNVLSKSTSFSIMCSEDTLLRWELRGLSKDSWPSRHLKSCCTCSTSLVSKCKAGWHQVQSQLREPARQLDSTWSRGDGRLGMAWEEGIASEGRMFLLVKNLAVEGIGGFSATI